MSFLSCRLESREGSGNTFRVTTSFSGGEGLKKSNKNDFRRIRIERPKTKQKRFKTPCN
jgi:hypothetical protein